MELRRSRGASDKPAIVWHSGREGFNSNCSIKILEAFCLTPIVGRTVLFIFMCMTMYCMHAFLFPIPLSPLAVFFVYTCLFNAQLDCGSNSDMIVDCFPNCWGNFIQKLPVDYILACSLYPHKVCKQEPDWVASAVCMLGVALLYSCNVWLPRELYVTRVTVGGTAQIKII